MIKAQDNSVSPSLREITVLGVASLAFAFASFGFVQKHGGLTGVTVYTALVFAAFLVAWVILRKFHPLLERQRLSLAAIFLVGASVAFAVIYPIENGKGLGKGSDRDDGLNIAVSRLVEGETPYYPPHPKAGPLSVLPGSILLATPFALLGNSAYQNPFWIACLLLALRRWPRAQISMLFLLGLSFAVSPAFQYEWISGGDLIANGIFLPLSIWLFLRVWADSAGNLPVKLASSLFLGIALCSRLNEVLLLPIIGGALWALAGFPRAVIATGIAVATATLLSVPFYLHDPSGFTPLIAGNKLLLLQNSFPFAGETVKLLTSLVSLGCGIALITGKIRPQASLVFLCAAVTTALPLLLSVLFLSFAAGSIDFSFLHPRYGLLYLLPAFFAAAFHFQPEAGWKKTGTI